jgi:hypothetical protein
VALAKALSRLEEHIASGGWLRLKTIARAAVSRGTPATLRPYLERMALLSPRSRQEWLWQRLLLQELQALA